MKDQVFRLEAGWDQGIGSTVIRDRPTGLVLFVATEDMASVVADVQAFADRLVNNTETVVAPVYSDGDDAFPGNLPEYVVQYQYADEEIWRDHLNFYDLDDAKEAARYWLTEYPMHPDEQVRVLLVRDGYPEEVVYHITLTILIREQTDEG